MASPPDSHRPRAAWLSLWQPQIIKSFGLTNMQTGLLNSIPFGIASVLMIIWGRSSDRTGERIWHTAIPLALLAAISAVGCLLVLTIGRGRTRIVENASAAT